MRFTFRHILAIIIATAALVSCGKDKPASSEESDFRMMLRLWPAHHDDAVLSEELLNALKEYDFCDEVWFCGQESATKPAAIHEASAEKMALMADKFRDMGIIPSLQVVALGHGDGAVPDTSIHWGTMVGPNGEKTHSVNCPRQEAYLEAMEKAFVPYVEKVKPHSIYLDDDLRLVSHSPAPMGCYCDTCVDLFNKEYGYSFNRETLVAGLLANKENGELRKKWVAFGQESLAGVVRAISRGVHKVSPETRIGLQHTSFHRNLLDGWDWNPMFRAMKEETGLTPVSRPGHGFYNDHAPRGMIEKGLELARQIRRLEPGITEIAPEIEGYLHKATGKTAQSICLETMYYLSMGATQMSYAIICGSQEPMSWYSSHYFKALTEVKPFAKEYADFNRGTLPTGINPYLSPNQIARNVESGEDPWDWSVDKSLSDDVYELAALGMPFAPDDPRSRVVMIDGTGARGMTDNEIKGLLDGFGVVMDSDAWTLIKDRGLLEGYETCPAPTGDAGDYDNPSITKGARYSDALSRMAFFSKGGRKVVRVRSFKPTLTSGGDFNGAFRLALTRAFDWASGQTLPAILESMAQVALVSRTDDFGRLRSVALMNCGISHEDSYTIRLRPGTAGPDPTFVWKRQGREDQILKPLKDDSGYILQIPGLDGWEFGWVAVQRKEGEGSCTAEGEVLPIMAWHSMPTNEFTLERFQELSEAGFNVNFSFMYNLQDALKALDLGQKTGVKIMFMCNELNSNPDSTAALVKDHPALWGYFLRDEPWCKDFPGLASWARKIEKGDPDHPMYLNLFPNAIDCPTIGAKDYRDYVQRFISEVSLPLLSFDHYPVKNDGLHDEWYENLEIIRDEALKNNLPFWAFAMCVPHWHYPTPRPQDLRLEMYTNLAYGASGVQYFTYWTPGPGSDFNYHDGPITNDGKRTAMYEYVKALNNELQARAGVFVGSTVEDVSFTGTGIPEGVSMMDTHGGRLLVSQLVKGEKRFLVIVSTSIEEDVLLDIAFKKDVSAVDRDGRYVPAGKDPRTIRIHPGDELIFRIK